MLILLAIIITGVFVKPDGATALSLLQIIKYLAGTAYFVVLCSVTDFSSWSANAQ